MDPTFDPQLLAADLREVRRIYAGYFAKLTDAVWERPARRGAQEWNIRATVAHLCALSSAGLDSIKAARRGTTYVFAGLDDRYRFNAYNEAGIAAHLSCSRVELCTRWLDTLDEAVTIAAELTPEQAAQTSAMPIYNRPVALAEVLAIIMFHAGLHHSAQVADPAGVPPLWTQLSPEIRHRVIGRVMRALSLLYRQDLGGDLRATIAFRIDGTGGGSWYVQVSPEKCLSGAGPVNRPTLTFHFRKTDEFCKLFTNRFNLPLALLAGRLKLRGDLRLFTRFGSLFSVDAHP